jgi:hypothetical protein
VVEDNIRDIDMFALQTLTGLIAHETALLKLEPSLCTFARLDIGIIPDADGLARFFINEFERLPNVTLWRGEEHVGPVAAALDHSLYKATKARHTVPNDDNNV